MRWSDIPLNPTSRTLRQFAALWIVFFAGIAAWQYWHHERSTLAVILLVLAVTVGPIGLVRPNLLRPIFVGWMCVAFPIGWVISHIALALLFYGIMTPVAVIFRLSGRDALARRRRSGQDTYWQRKPMPANVQSYYRQS
jgi:hypothetical protein